MPEEKSGGTSPPTATQEEAEFFDHMFEYADRLSKDNAWLAEQLALRNRLLARVATALGDADIGPIERQALLTEIGQTTSGLWIKNSLLYQARELQRTYERDQVDNVSITYRIAGLCTGHAMHPEEADLREAWKLLVLAGSIIRSYEEAAEMLLAERKEGQVDDNK